MRLLVLILALLAPTFAAAHDHRRPGLNEWYKGLHSSIGPCCDGTDALHLSSVDWESRDGHYRVRVPLNGSDFNRARNGEDVNMQWVDVPESAVLAMPNLDGQTMVWPMYGYQGVSIRCFMPGSMT